MQLTENGEREETFNLVDTTAGRALLSEILPDGLPFELVNQTMKKRAISSVIDEAYRRVGLKDTVIFCDKLMYTGFSMAARAGVSIGVDDMAVPDSKSATLDAAEAEVKAIQEQHGQGLLTDGERYNKVVDIWTHASDQVAGEMMDELSVEKVVNAEGETIEQESFNSIYMMADSGARGSHAQIRQLAGMRGLMANRMAPLLRPDRNNFREGLNVNEYFISTTARARVWRIRRSRQRTLVT